MVYDILDSGQRHRFMVLTCKGPIIVHNCTQAVARDFLIEAMLRVDKKGYVIHASVHDEIIASSKNGTIEELNNLMSICPEWALDCPISAEGFEGYRYKK